MSAMQLVVFRLDGLRCALLLPAVERIVRAVAVTPLHQAPEVVLGVIDVAGRVIPVFDMRHRLRLPARAIAPEQQFAIVQAARRTVALVVDSVDGVVAAAADAVVATQDIAPGLAHLRGVVQLPDGLVLIHDLEQFLSLDEARALDAALHSRSSHGG